VRSRFQFVDDHRDAFEVKRLCEVLDLNRSSYYKWLSGGAYGSQRVTAELRDQGLHVNEKRITRVMRTFAITGVRLRRRQRRRAEPVTDSRQQRSVARHLGSVHDDVRQALRCAGRG
jgi:transposase InsO family protein